MKATLTLLVILCGYISGYAQTWVEQNSGTNTILRDVFFISQAKGWAVGDQAKILTTVDGGTTWTAQNANTGSVSLTSVFFTSPTKGWVVGAKETILTTDDGGNTWLVVSDSGNQINFNDVYFPTPDTGYIVGSNGTPGIVKRTFNGGQTWQTSTTTRGLESVHFTSALKGWACGSRGVIFNTVNGFNWIEQVAEGANQTFNLVNVFMLTDSIGWVSGNPANIFCTKDAGATWTQKASGTFAAKTDIHYLDTLRGWAITTSPLGGGQPVRYTIDGGNTWIVDTTMNLPTLNSLQFISDTLGWAVGEGGTIIRYGIPFIATDARVLSAESILSIYPNPASNIIFVSSSQAVQTAIVYNITGEQIISAKGEIKTIDVSSLLPGDYVVKLITRNGEQLVKRFLKN